MATATRRRRSRSRSRDRPRSPLPQGGSSTSVPTHAVDRGGAGDTGDWFVIKKIRLYTDTSLWELPGWFWSFNTLPRQRVHDTLYYAQMVICALMVIAAIIFPEGREFILAVARRYRDTLLVIIMEIVLLGGLTITVFSVFKKVPVSWIAAVITHLFLNLQPYCEKEVLNLEQTEDRQEKENNMWTWSWPFGRKDKEVFVPIPVPPGPLLDGKEPGVHLFLALIGLTYSLFWLLTKFIKIRIDRFGNTVLVMAFISSCGGSVLLASSLRANKDYPDFEAWHLYISRIWTSYSTFVAFFSSFYVVQRYFVRKEEFWREKGSWADMELTWMCVEVVAFIIPVAILLKLLPSFHGSLVFPRDFMVPKWTDLIEALIPGPVTFLKETAFPHVRTIATGVFENYYNGLVRAKA